MLDDYRLHKLVWKLFQDGGERKRDFLYRVSTEAGALILWTVSEREPRHEGRDWLVSSKSYAPNLRQGDRLHFLLRANATRAVQDRDGGHDRHDVVMDHKARLRRQGVPKEQWPPMARICQQAGLEWLAARHERGGFRVSPDEVRVDEYRQREFSKSGQAVKISTLDFQGVLTVWDPDRFKEVLFRGMGPAKGFGCGLVLVRRVP
jgi:CRISPR system Cascade subunit CasE